MTAARFLPGARSAIEAVELDAGQRAVVVLPDDASAAVLGAPGSGKTRTIVEVVADRVLGRGWTTDEVLVLTSSRAAATLMRDRLALRLGVATDGPMARTVPSLAFELVGAAARRAGADPPRLVTGGEQDADIGALLEGHLDTGTGPSWPEPLTPDVRRLRGFRTELRELMARATEFDVPPARLRQLGEATGRPEWIAAADFVDEYLGIVSTARATQLDSAELARFAVAAIDDAVEGDRVTRLRLVLVDDLQEATESSLAILRALARRGVAIIAFGDPDIAANAFRGGEPDALGRLGSVLGLPDLHELVLPAAHRHGPALRSLVSSIVERVGAAAAGAQRKAVPAGSDLIVAGRPPLARIEAATPARERAAIARVLREEHLLHGVPWERLAVVVRSGDRAPDVARALALAEVPTRLSGGGVALREESATRALLAIVEAGIGRVELDPTTAADLLVGPFGGLDPIGLRRLRVALRVEEVAGGGTRTSGELLAEALAAPGRFATIDTRVARIAERLATTLHALRTAAADGATIEDLLWIAWDRSGRARVWRDQALGAGPGSNVAAAEANRNLDGIVALFASAKRFSERRPDAPAEEFLAELLDSEVPEDVLAPQRGGAAVLVTTPSGTVGLEFDTVIVAGLQDGAWPNLRPRGSLLSPQRLAAAVAGDDTPLDERRLVLDDELRMLGLAVSRARDRVVFSAVSNDDEARSRFFALLPDAPLLESAAAPPLSLRGLTGRLRRELTSQRGDTAGKAAAASALRRLADLGVAGADPAEWHGLLEPTTGEPLFGDDQVPVSPSRLERFEESPLDWFLETIAGSQPTTAMSVGTILHWAMETATDPSAEAIWAAVESRWSELVFESPWLAEYQRRASRVLADGIAAYLQDFRAAGKQLVAAEGRFSFDLDRATVNGSIDRVERAADGSVVIVDLKTGSPITQQARIDEHPQLGVYQLAYREGLLDEFLAELGEHRGGGAKLLYVKQGTGGKAYREAEQAALDDAGLETFRHRIRQAAIGMAAAQFEGVLELRSYGLGNVAQLRLHRVGAVSGE